MKRNHTHNKSIEEDLPNIRIDYVVNGFTLNELVTKYEISRGTVNKYSVQEGWVIQRKEFLQKKNERVLEKTLDNKVEQIVDRNTVHLNKWNKLFDKLEELSPQIKTLGALQTATNIMTQIQRGERLCLCLDGQNSPMDMQKIVTAIEQYRESVKLDPSEIEKLYDDEEF